MMKMREYMEDSTVEHPEHYNLEGMYCEAIDVIRAVLGDRFPAFCRGNALKYLIRADRKGGIDDLKKAHRYLAWEIDEAERAEIARKAIDGIKRQMDS